MDIDYTIKKLELPLLSRPKLSDVIDLFEKWERLLCLFVTLIKINFSVGIRVFDG